MSMIMKIENMKKQFSSRTCSSNTFFLYHQSQLIPIIERGKGYSMYTPQCPLAISDLSGPPFPGAPKAAKTSQNGTFELKTAISRSFLAEICSIFCGALPVHIHAS